MPSNTATFLTLAAMVARATGGTAPPWEGQDVDWRAFVGLCRDLDAAGLRFLVLKGVPLSCLLHGDPARPSWLSLHLVRGRGRIGPRPRLAAA